MNYSPEPAQAPFQIELRAGLFRFALKLVQEGRPGSVYVAALQARALDVVGLLSC